MEVKRVLELDNLSRNKDAVRILYDQTQLDTKKSWDFSLPTLVSNENPFHNSELKKVDIERVKKDFNLKYPEFKNVDMNNILIAGGCIGNFITSNNSSDSDIDIFVYDLTKEAAEKKIIEIYNSIKKELQNIENKKMYPHKITLSFIRTPKYTLIDNKYQIIHRLYKDKAEILHGFDIGSSSVGFDKEKIYFTELSKFSYEYGCNIVDTSRRSTSYEHRLQKYFKRGFDIILPYFDINKTSDELYRTHNLPPAIVMPNLLFTHNCIYGNKIIVSKFYNRKNADISDYETEHTNGGDEEYIYFYMNIKKILKGNTDLMLYSQDLDDNRDATQMSSARIDYFYDTMFNDLYKSSKFPTQKCINYLCDDTLKIFKIKDDKDELTKVFQEVKTKVKNAIKNIIVDIPWISDNPGTQLTSSFNPIIENPEKWYGEYYKSI
jgi:hypothetical protein